MKVLNNFAGMFAVNAAFQSSSVWRLTHSIKVIISLSPPLDYNIIHVKMMSHASYLSTFKIYSPMISLLPLIIYYTHI